MSHSHHEYIEKTKSRLDELDANIAKLEARAEKAGTGMKAKIRKELEEIRDSRRDAGKKLDELKATGSAAGQDLKAGTELAWQSLADAVKRASKRFSSDAPH